MTGDEQWLCDECGYVGTYLIAPSPFDTVTITGCPKCHAVESFVSVCWKCDKPGTMGIRHPTKRYIHSCWEHRYIKEVHDVHNP